MKVRISCLSACALVFISFSGSVKFLPENVIAISLQTRSWVYLSESRQCVQVCLPDGRQPLWGPVSTPAPGAGRQAPCSTSPSLYLALLCLSPKSQGKRRVTHCKGRRPCWNLIALWAKLLPGYRNRFHTGKQSLSLYENVFVMQTTWI